MSFKPTEQQLKLVVDSIFTKYDTNKSGTLEASEVAVLINDAFKGLGKERQVTQKEVLQFIEVVDKNSDKKIGKPELFQIMKKVL